MVGGCEVLCGFCDKVLKWVGGGEGGGEKMSNIDVLEDIAGGHVDINS